MWGRGKPKEKKAKPIFTYECRKGLWENPRRHETLV